MHCEDKELASTSSNHISTDGLKSSILNVFRKIFLNDGSSNVVDGNGDLSRSPTFLRHSSMSACNAADKRKKPKVPFAAQFPPIEWLPSNVDLSKDSSREVPKSISMDFIDHSVRIMKS